MQPNSLYITDEITKYDVITKKNLISNPWIFSSTFICDLQEYFLLKLFFVNKLKVLLYEHIEKSASINITMMHVYSHIIKSKRCHDWRPLFLYFRNQWKPCCKLSPTQGTAGSLDTLLVLIYLKRGMQCKIF